MARERRRGPLYDPRCSRERRDGDRGCGGTELVAEAGRGREHHELAKKLAALLRQLTSNRADVLMSLRLINDYPQAKAPVLHDEVS